MAIFWSILADDARKDSLGHRGSLEANANAGAVVDRATEALEAGKPSSLAKRRAGGEPITPRIVAEEAERGDQVARQVIMETAHFLAIGIVTLVHTIDPDAVVLGGAMNFGGPASALGREFIQRIRDEVRPRLLEPLRDQSCRSSLPRSAATPATSARLAWRGSKNASPIDRKPC